MATLRQVRIEHYISQRELADLAGVSESTIVRMEDPKHRTRQDIAEKVVKALSERIGKSLALENIESLNLYNVMRDRRQRTRENASSSEDTR
jgi:DNA-binding XRE family transcriptional regulator